MTPTSYFRDLKLLNRSSTLQYRSDPAALRLMDTMSGHSEPGCAVLQDPFAYYRAFLDTNVPPDMGTTRFAQDKAGYTCHTGAIGQGSQTLGIHQPSARAVPHNLAVRLANRSNGAPLATIVEQGSFSTLNSHSSLLSVGRFPFLRVAENASPKCSTNRRSRSLDEKALHNIQEDAFLEQGALVVTEVLEMPSVDRWYERSHSGCSTETPAKLVPLEYQDSQINDQDYDSNGRGVKGFFHGVLQSVRAAPRTRSRSSSMTHAVSVDSREDRVHTMDSSPQIQHHDMSSKTPQMNNHKSDASNHAQSSSSSAASKHALEPKLRNRKISTANSEPSAQTYPPLLHVPPPKFEPTTKNGAVPLLLPRSLVTRSRESSLSPRSVLPERCDATRGDGMLEAQTLSNRSRDAFSAQYTSDGVLVAHENAPLLTEGGRAKYASRNASWNASFCSTMSTSYSGTVLGIDLDLQHELAHQSCPSRSPTPVWFTPQMAELERQVSSSECPEWKQPTAAETPSRLITSSALMSLLPIATASGIVRPNYNTPKISFYSPSGNLIQPEGYLTPAESMSEYGSLAITTTLYHDKTNLPSANNTLLATPCLPAARPSLLPMSTPPTSKAPLPTHLRHHHNYRHPELSQISTYESLPTSCLVVKGCGGVVRKNSFSPRSGVALVNKNEESGALKHLRLSRSNFRLIRSEAKFYKSRFINQVSSASCTPSLPPIPKGKTLQKRRTSNLAMHAGGKPHTRVNASSTGTSFRANGDRLEGCCSSLSANALRMCICQSRHRTGVGSYGKSMCAESEWKRNAGTEADGDVEPNVRITRKGGKKRAIAL